MIVKLANVVPIAVAMGVAVIQITAVKKIILSLNGPKPEPL
jgi:hypothetical protein